MKTTREIEVTLHNRADGMVDVRLSAGHLELCANDAEARIYAKGLADGYNVAVNRLGRCKVIAV